MGCRNGVTKWVFKDEELSRGSSMTVRGVLETIMGNLNEADDRPLVHLGRGDPSPFPSFRTCAEVEEAMVEAVRCAKHNGYAPAVGLYSTRRSIADHLSSELPFKLSPDDIYLTVGANHGIEVVLRVLARPGANVLLPRPGYPTYEAHAAFCNLEVRHYDLLPGNGWEVDLNSVVSLADENTIAMVIINPGNPCGNVLKYEHLSEIAETSKKLGILVVADEVYSHLSFGSNKFVPMGVFGMTCPVLTLGSLSKRWIIPGWRLGWIALNDPNAILKESGIAEWLQSYLELAANPATIIQGAVPDILEKTNRDFFSRITDTLRESAESCYLKLKEIPCLSCPYKPEGAMSTMMKLDLSQLKGIESDMDFCLQLAKEESVILLPGDVLGMKNWLRVTFAIELATLEDGLQRIKSFCLRHAKNQRSNGYS